MSNIVNSLSLTMNASGKGYNPYRNKDGTFASGPSAVTTSPLTEKNYGESFGPVCDYKPEYSGWMKTADKVALANCLDGRDRDIKKFDSIAEKVKSKDKRLYTDITNLAIAADYNRNFIRDTYGALYEYVARRESKESVLYSYRSSYNYRVRHDKKVDALTKKLKASKNKEVSEFVGEFYERYRNQTRTVEDIFVRYFKEETDRRTK